jgi:hypothetical protein
MYVRNPSIPSSKLRVSNADFAIFLIGIHPSFEQRQLRWFSTCRVFAFVLKREPVEVLLTRPIVVSELVTLPISIRLEVDSSKLSPSVLPAFASIFYIAAAKFRVSGTLRRKAGVQLVRVSD